MGDMEKNKNLDPNELELEYVPLSYLKAWPGNPKLHEIVAIQASIETYGFRDPVEKDAQTGQLLAGHGRKEALEGLKALYQEQGKPPPLGIVEKAGEWWVPCIKSLPFPEGSSPEGYLLANNKTQSVGGVDKDLLKKMLVRVEKTREGLKGTGYSIEELDLLRSKNKTALETMTGVKENAPHAITDEEAEELLQDSLDELPSPGDATKKSANPHTITPQMARPIGPFYFTPDLYESLYAKLQGIQTKRGLPSLADTLQYLILLEAP